MKKEFNSVGIVKILGLFLDLVRLLDPEKVGGTCPTFHRG